MDPSGSTETQISDSESRDGDGDSSVTPKSAVAGEVKPTESSEPKPEETLDDQTQAPSLGGGI
jgi:hypothetical protein